MTVKNADIYGKGCCCSSFDLGCCGICRSGYVDDGCTCRKNVALYFKESYGRTAGIPMNCKNDEEEDAGLFLNLILKIKIIYLLTLLFSRTVLYSL